MRLLGGDVDREYCERRFDEDYDKTCVPSLTVARPLARCSCCFRMPRTPVLHPWMQARDECLYSPLRLQGGPRPSQGLLRILVQPLQEQRAMA